MRLSGGRINKVQKGGYAGGTIALGYKTKNKKLMIDEKQAEVIKMIFKMKRYKRMGLRKIARELNGKDLTTARGGKWYGWDH